MILQSAQIEEVKADETAKAQTLNRKGHEGTRRKTTRGSFVGLRALCGLRF